MKKRYLIYIIIAIICIIAIGVGIYYQLKSDRPEQPQVTNEIEQESDANKNEDDPEVILKEFNSILTNAFYTQGNDTTSVKRLAGHEEQEIVYAAYNIEEERNGKYSININLPAINIDSDVVAEFNNTTNKLFSNKAAEVINTSDKYTIYNIDYVAYLNGNILSVVIKSTLKEADSAQRIIVQTYNYNIETQQAVTLNEILDQKQITHKSVNKKIEKQIKEAAKRTAAIAGEYASQGKLVYERDINQAMYGTDYVNDFFMGKDGQLYIVFAYGNTYHTDEMDVVKIEQNVNQ